MAKRIKETGPAAVQARRDLGVVLKDLRQKAGFSKQRLAAKTGISAPRIDAFERGLYLPESEDISKYIEVALEIEIFPEELLKAFGKAKDEEIGFNMKLPTDDLLIEVSNPLRCDRYATGNIFDQAAADPKALLLSAYWLPSMAQSRINLIERYEKYCVRYKEVSDFCLQISARSDSFSPQEKERAVRLVQEGEKLSGLVKEHCTDLAREASLLIKRYKKIGEVFDTYAGDLPGYEVTKKQFYLGLTLEEVLQTACYTRRWTQTLQERTLRTFQERIKSAYVE